MAMAMSNRWNAVVGNDLNPATIRLLDAVLIHKGQIEYEHPAPCSRNDFFVSLQKIKNGDFDIRDCVNKYCASFGNDGKTYLYGEEIERAKVSAETMLTAPTLEQRRHAYRDFMRCLIDEGGGVCGLLERLQNLQQLSQIERLQRLERLERLNIFDIDYSEFDCVYFDIPYKGTNKYDFEFDYERFYELFRTIGRPAFLSEYDAPFTCVAEFEKTQLMAASVGSTKSTSREKLFFNGTTEEYKTLMGRFFEEKSTQISLF